MTVKLSAILNTGIENIELISYGEFNSFALTNGKLKKDDKLIVYINSDCYISEVNENQNIECVICTKDILIKLNSIDKISRLGILITDNPKAAFFSFHNYLNRNTDFYKNDFKNKIDSSAQIHSTCVLPDKNIKIGKNVIFRPFVVVYENSIIEDNVIIRENSVIGHPAFYYYEINGAKIAVDSTGGVKIKENVEINSHVVICKGTLGGMTEIRNGTKIDSHVFIGHDVLIKDNCLVPAGSIFAGSVTLNENCFVGIGSKFVPQVNIGENVMIAAGSIITKDVKNDSHVFGNIVIDNDNYSKLNKLNK